MKMGGEFVVRCPEPGVAVPQNVLLHEYVLHRDYHGQGEDRVAFLDGVSGRTITHQQASDDIGLTLIAECQEHSPCQQGNASRPPSTQDQGQVLLLQGQWQC